MTGYRQRAVDLLTAVYGPGPHSEAAVDVQIRKLRESDDFPGGDDFPEFDEWTGPGPCHRDERWA